MTHLGIALNGDSRIATHQSGIAMLLFACAATIHATHDDGRTCDGTTWCYTIARTYRHHRILLHAANLATAIDVASHRAIIDVDSCSAIWIGYAIVIFSDHGFVTEEVVGFTLTATIDVAGDVSTQNVLISTIRILVSCCIVTLVQFDC